MSVRVIAGRYRSRVLATVRGMQTRPLRAQVREALFSVLGDSLDGIVVWDLFAGCGATGIEALSRGAARVVFVEKNNGALAVVRQNLAALGDDAVAAAQVFKADAWEVDLPELRDERPDLVFLDPPYAAVAEDPVRAACRAAQLSMRLAPGGRLCFHFEQGQLDEDDFDDDLGVELRNWGRSTLALLSAPAPAPH